MLANVDPYQDIREAVRDLCSNFPAEYFRKVDETAPTLKPLCKL